MSILTGRVTAEQLMKYVLYCEWLIYAAWRVKDNLSSLLQTVGATENVFQFMNLMPSDQFLSKGMKLQRLMGKIEFVNISFYYPSRWKPRGPSSQGRTVFAAGKNKNRCFGLIKDRDNDVALKIFLMT